MGYGVVVLYCSYSGRRKGVPNNDVPYWRCQIMVAYSYFGSMLGTAQDCNVRRDEGRVKETISPQ